MHALGLRVSFVENAGATPYLIVLISIVVVRISTVIADLAVRISIIYKNKGVRCANLYVLNCVLFFCCANLYRLSVFPLCESLRKTFFAVRISTI